MKTIRPFFIVLTFLLTTVTFYSCLDDDDKYPWPDNALEAIVTVKPLEGNAYYMQLDDSTTLIPANDYVPYFGTKEEQRAYIIFTPERENVQGYNASVNIFVMDSILTKPIAENLGEEKNDEIYGKDPVEMWDIWVEDGYLSFRFSTYYSGRHKHFINLIQPDSLNAPYEVEFRHNAYGDTDYMYAYDAQKGWGWVSFSLDKLPDTEGKTVKLKIKYKSSTSGYKTYELDYCTRRPAGKKASVTNLDGLRAIIK